MSTCSLTIFASDIMVKVLQHFNIVSFFSLIFSTKLHACTKFVSVYSDISRELSRNLEWSQDCFIYKNIQDKNRRIFKLSEMAHFIDRFNIQKLQNLPV